MDYASGNYYGKYLIRAYYFNKMPEYLREEFAESFDLSPNTIKNKLLEKLPFSLTEDQKSVLKTIYINLNSKERMFRLLQGDVGSGKTIVAFFSILHVVENGYQGALMAPTEILAYQHYNFFKQYEDYLKNLY